MRGGRGPPLRSDTIFAEDIRAQVDRILTSLSFRIPERSQKLLRYVVEETLAGRADRIKAYSIATIAFGRDSSFDPQSDPVVRIEAGHLRRALERYYLTAGQQDPIRITIPTGGYVPCFSQGNLRQEPRAGDLIEVEMNGAVLRFGADANPKIVEVVIKALKDKA
jgi:hypothetical protein